MANFRARGATHGFGRLRRALILLGALAVAGVLFTSATSAVPPPVRDYVTNISKTDVAGGDSLTVTITNCDSGTPGCAAASTESIASADLSIADGGSFDPTDAAIAAPASGWSLADNSGTIVLTADSGSELAPGDSVSVQFSAPSAPDSYSTTTHAFHGADDATGGFSNNGTDPAFVVHGPLDHFTLTNPTPTPEKAGDPFTVDVAALDVNGNAAADWMDATNCVVFSGPASSPNPVTDPSYPDKGGCSDGQSELHFDTSGQVTASITLFKAESPTLKVEDTGGSPKNGTIGLTVNGGSLAHLTLSAPGSSVTAGTGFTVDVTAHDGWGNPAGGWASTTNCVKFSGPGTSPGPVATPPLYPVQGSCSTSDKSELTFDGTGKAAGVPITLYKAESPTLKVEDAATGTISDSAGLTVDPAGLDHFTLTNPTPATPTAGTAFTVDVAVGSPGTELEFAL